MIFTSGAAYNALCRPKVAGQLKNSNLIVMLFLCNRLPTIKLKQSTIATDSGLHLDTVKESLRWLDANGWISREIGNKRRHISTEYFINFQKLGLTNQPVKNGISHSAPVDVSSELFVKYDAICNDVSKTSPWTPTKEKAMRKVATDSGMSLEAVIQVCVEKNWATCKASWLTQKTIAKKFTTKKDKALEAQYHFAETYFSENKSRLSVFLSWCASNDRNLVDFENSRFAQSINCLHFKVWFVSDSGDSIISKWILKIKSIPQDEISAVDDAIDSVFVLQDDRITVRAALTQRKAEFKASSARFAQ